MGLRYSKSRSYLKLDLGEGLAELLDHYGPVFNLRFLWSDLVITASPEHIKTMLSTDFQNFVKGGNTGHE